MKSTNDIKFGDVSIPDDAFEPKNVKARITTFIDMDLLDAIRKQAALQNKGYQTLINEKLRDLFMGERAKLEDRVTALEALVGLFGLGSKFNELVAISAKELQARAKKLKKDRPGKLRIGRDQAKRGKKTVFSAYQKIQGK